MNAPLEIPVAFGHWIVQSDKLVCRLPRKAVTVRAPHELLVELLHLCDGSLSWLEITARLGEHWNPDTVAAFMLQLVREQVLVEASELWAHWSDVAQLPALTAIAASPADVAQLHRRAESRLLPGEGVWNGDIRSRSNALAALLGARESSRTFDDASISAESLCSILWAAHGVARKSRTKGLSWHRTVASGGNMHSARWFVAVLRKLPAEQAGRDPVEPGIYEGRFHQSGGASLELIGKRSDEAWRCLRDPRVLRFASALVLPFYDVAIPGRKYGNRATLFATIESGQSLQNAQLMATALGIAGMLRGDTIASEALVLAGLDQAGPSHWLSLPGMVVGVEPSTVQRAQQLIDDSLKVAPNLETRCDAGSRAASFAFAAWSTESRLGALLGASGRADDPRLAMTKAEAEAWERLGWATPSLLIEARSSELAEFVPPHDLIAYSQRQQASSGFACKAYSSRRRYLWKEAIDASGRARHVLAECVYAHASLPARCQAQAYTSASTSGVAAGATLAEAFARATLELIERDAFVCAWLSGQAPVTVEPASLPRAAARRIDALQTSGVKVAVLNISTAWAPVIAVFAQSADLPFTAITAAAAFDPEQALTKAMEEAEGRIAHAQNSVPAPADTDAMRQIERYYRSHRTFRRSDFFAQSDRTVRFKRVGLGLPRQWEGLKARILSDGFDLLSVDMTPAQAAVDQGRTPLHVVRAFVPGLVPIWFQRGMQPEGMPRFIKSAGGAQRRPANFFIHPFT